MIKELVKSIKEEATKRYDKEFVVLYQNSIKGDCVVLGYPDEECKPCIYLKEYGLALENGISMKEVVEDIFEKYEKAKNGKISITFNSIVERLDKDVYIQVVSSELEKQFIENDIAYGKYLDLLICYRIVIPNILDGTGSLLIPNSLIKCAGMTKEHIHKVAVENTKNDNWSIITMADILTGTLGVENIINVDDEMYIIGQEAIFGSACIFTKSGIKELAKKLNSNILILPSSTEELILVAYGAELACNISRLRHMVREINCTAVPESEFLSNNIYLYLNDEDEIIIL